RRSPLAEQGQRARLRVGRRAQQASHRGPLSGRRRECAKAGQREGKTTASTGSTRRRAAPEALWPARLSIAAAGSEESLLLLLLAGDAALGPGHGLQALLVHLVLADH